MLERVFRKIFYPKYQFTPSYAQSGEDILIERGLKMTGVKKATYLDIGSNHPITLSNTYLLYTKGAKGVCVEPNPIFNSLMKKYRPNDKLLNIGVSNENQESIKFYNVKPHVLSTFDRLEVEQLIEKGIVEIQEILEIPVFTINQIIEEHFQNTPDLISVDVEGWNQEIIESFDFSLYRPKVFCIETITFTTNNTGLKIMPILNYLKKNGYWILGETYVNTIFIDGHLAEQRTLI